MIQSLLKTLINKRSNPVPIHLRFLHKSISKKRPEDELKLKPSSSTISYLVNSCGLTPQSAITTANKIQLKSTHKSDFILKSFKSYGFKDTHIANIITKWPILLSSNWDKTIKPKLDYLRAIGYSDTELAALVSSAPWVITTSLEKRLKPNLELLRSIIGNIQLIALAIRRTSRLITGNLETSFLPNVRAMQACGAPAASIARLATRYPRAVMMSSTEQFKAAVETVNEMGFNPKSTLFVRVVAAMSHFNPSTWDKKVEFFRSMGWSDREVYSAFAKEPSIMLLSKQKIEKGMNFAMRRLQWTPSFVSARPVFLSLSLEKRVMPRCSVLEVLESKGLKMRSSSVTFLKISEKDFITKYVTKYMEKVPAVLEAYKSNLEAVGPEGGLISLNGS